MCGCLKRVALTRHLTLSLTGEATAVAEVQFLHAFGEDECTDITCEGRTKRELREDGRRENAAHTYKAKRVHSQKQLVNFTTVSPTPFRLTFQLDVIVEVEVPKVRHVHIADRQRAFQVFKSPVNLHNLPPVPPRHPLPHSIDRPPDALGKGSERLLRVHPRQRFAGSAAAHHSLGCSLLL